MRIHAALLSLTLSSLAGCNYGGCVFTRASRPVVAPVTSCLTLTTLPTDGTTVDGCVIPDLSVHNDCSDDLVFAATEDGGTTQTITAGGTGVYSAASDSDHDGASYSIPAMLGQQTMTITFKVSGGYL